MFKVAWKNVLGHKVRVLLTAVAVVVGVAFMAGTFVLTDTIKKGFDDLFADANEGVDAVIRQEAAFEVGADSSFVTDQRDEISLDLLPEIEAVDGVAAADASIQGSRSSSTMTATRSAPRARRRSSAATGPARRT
jgi:putative ABC transport system permease protein